MTDVPQFTPDPYDRGDSVLVYLAPDDPDGRFHGLKCVVIDRFEDSLDAETGRELDKYSYRVKRVDSNDVVDVQFRHLDLVPTG